MPRRWLPSRQSYWRRYANMSAWLSDFYNYRYGRGRIKGFPEPAYRASVVPAQIVSVSAGGSVGPPSTWKYELQTLSDAPSEMFSAVKVNPALRHATVKYDSFVPGSVVLVSLTSLPAEAGEVIGDVNPQIETPEKPQLTTCS